MDRGPRIEDRRPRIEDRDTQTEDRRPGIEDRGWRIEDRGSRSEERRSRIENRESRIEGRGWKVDGWTGSGRSGGTPQGEFGTDVVGTDEAGPPARQVRDRSSDNPRDEFGIDVAGTGVVARTSPEHAWRPPPFVEDFGTGPLGIPGASSERTWPERTTGRGLLGSRESEKPPTGPKKAR